MNHDNINNKTDALMITGGAGFIGQNLVQNLVRSKPKERIIVYDALTYAANLSGLQPLIDRKKIEFVRGDITDLGHVTETIARCNVNRIAHLAAESHVDRSIIDPDAFFNTNILGTYTLLKAARDAWVDPTRSYRFLHVSTDEVFGDLDDDARPFTEDSHYRPSSPYSASKASSDHWVRAFHRTYDLPVMVTTCSNNYGPYQHPEKLVPIVILNCLRGLYIPVYGDGRNIRDWLHVEDHCAALATVLENGVLGETYCVGGGSESSNIDLIKVICDAVDLLLVNSKKNRMIWPRSPAAQGGTCHDLIKFVRDRPGHDRRYAIDNSKIATELNVRPKYDFESGILATVNWYMDNENWWRAALNGDYEAWVNQQYGEHKRHSI